MISPRWHGCAGASSFLTNAPADYTARVLGVLGIRRLFDGVIPIERCKMFGHFAPSPTRACCAAWRAAARGAGALRARRRHARAPEGGAARRHGHGLMQRWTRAATWGVARATRVTVSPPYVDLRVSSLRGA